MSMRDGISRKQVKACIPPQQVTDNTPVVGTIIDRQGYDELSYLIATGAIGDPDATFTVLVEEGDDPALSDAAAAADGDLISQDLSVAPETAAGFQVDDDNGVRKSGYRGSKQYTRLTVTPSGNDSSPALAAHVSALAVLERAGNYPITQAAS